MRFLNCFRQLRASTQQRPAPDQLAHAVLALAAERALQRAPPSRLDRVRCVVGWEEITSSTIRYSFWMSISVACPCTSPSGWWIMIRAWGGEPLALGTGGQQQRAQERKER
jgi:hypothetical protein